MAEIRSFRGVHYNESLLGEWSVVICPTYDIISPQQQQELYLSSDYNFIRLEFGRELPQDTATDNKYTRAANLMERWLEQGILEFDSSPALYIHDQYFTHQGKKHRRRGIVARVRVEEWDKMVVRPHEGTLSKPKNDRLSLLWALQANTSPILTLYSDREKLISSLLEVQVQSQPLLSLGEVGGEGHIVWAITEPDVVNQIATGLADQPLYIADGHHRYESALAYKHERTAGPSSSSGDEAFNFMMMTLVDFDDPGLIVLPPHRLVRGITRPTLAEFRSRLEVFFEVEEMPLNMPGVWEKVDRLGKGADKVRLVLFGLSAGNLCLLKLRDLPMVSQMIPYFHSELYKKLEVSIIDHVILENLLELSKDKEQASLAYSYDRADAIKRVLIEEYQLAFLLNPFNVGLIRAIADVGDKMPRKSTYFYPKLPAGIIVNRLI